MEPTELNACVSEQSYRTSNLRFKTSASENQKYIPETDGRPHSCYLCGEVFETEKKFLEYQEKQNKTESTSFVKNVITRNEMSTTTSHKTINSLLQTEISRVQLEDWTVQLQELEEEERHGTVLSYEKNEGKELLHQRESDVNAHGDKKNNLIINGEEAKENLKKAEKVQASHDAVDKGLGKTPFVARKTSKPVEEDKKDLSEMPFYKSSAIKRGRNDSSEKRHQCEVCKKSFQLPKDLKRHVRIHTGEKPHQCDVCNKSFTRLANLKTHLRIHTGEKPYECDQCNKTFSRSFHLTTHKRIHTGEKPYECDQCNKTFSWSNSLTMHKRVHTGEKLYACDQCNKAFAESSNLTKHKRIHTGERPYKCDQCDAAFAQSNDLVRHKRTHTGERPYKCDQCDKAFAHSSTLNKHKLIHIAMTLSV